MGSSEDYLDSLLRSMGVPEEQASPTKKESAKASKEPVKNEAPSIDAASIDINEVEKELAASDVFTDTQFEDENTDTVYDHSEDIPDLDKIITEDPAASDVHIDSAPSLDMPEDSGSEESDLSDLMSGLMSKFDSEELSDAETEVSNEADTYSEPELSVDADTFAEPEASDNVDVYAEPEASDNADVYAKPEASDNADVYAEPEVSNDSDAHTEPASDMPPIPLVDEYKATVNIDSTLHKNLHEDDNPDIDLDAQLADLLKESDTSSDLGEETGSGSGEKKSSDSVIDLDAFINGENSELSDLLGSMDASSDGSENSASSDDTDYSNFDLDAELAELMKEENESADLPGEDDIEAMLNKARSEGLSNDEDRSDMSLDDLLAADSGSASDIGDLLSKNDNNEAVDPGIEALLNGTDESMPDLFGDEKTEEGATLDPAAEKKRLKEEKKEARRKAKEEKARLKKEAREAKKKKKNAGNSVGEENALSYENLGNADMSDVDALLAGAAEAAAESKASALSTEAVPIPRQSREDNVEAVNAEADSTDAAEEQAEENSALDEADSLLAEIMGGSFGSEDGDQSGDPDAVSDEVSEEPQALSQDELDDILDKEAADKNRKKGFFARIISMLTESDDDEDASGSEIKLSDENAEVLEQLDAEGEEVGGKKKKKKKKKKGEEPAPDMEGVGEEVEGGEKKGKKKKAKKEKPPKEEDEKPSKKLNKTKVIAVFALCFTILAAVLIVSKLMGSYTVKREAREAYSAGDYQTAYQDLFGQDLNESDEIIFKKSECILRIRLWYREYEILKEESDIKALDSLIETVSRYPGLYQAAVKWNCLDDVEPVYRQVIDALYNEYGLTEEEAAQIAMIKNNVDYTRAVYAVIDGLNNLPSQEPAPEEPAQTQTPVIEDEIPGESDPGSDIIFVNP